MDAAERDGKTALMLAAEKGRVEVARLLLDRGAAVDAIAIAGQTALLFAARAKHAGIARFLMERGASADKILNMALNAVEPTRLLLSVSKPSDAVLSRMYDLGPSSRTRAEALSVIATEMYKRRGEAPKQRCGKFMERAHLANLVAAEARIEELESTVKRLREEKGHELFVQVALGLQQLKRQRVE